METEELTTGSRIGKKAGLHYAWAVCLGGALLFYCTSGLGVNVFSLYQPFFISHFGFSYTQASTILVLRNLFSFIGMSLSGLYYSKLSMRKGMALAGALNAFSYVLFGLSGSYTAICFSAAVLGISYGLGTMIPVAMVLKKWFHKRLATAYGICTAASGLSTIGIPSLLTAIITRCNLKTAFFAEAGIIFTMSLLCFLLVRSTPEEMGLKPFGAEEEEDPDRRMEEPEKPGEKKKKHLHYTYRPIGEKDWFLLFPMMLFLAAMTSVAYSNLSLLASTNGISAETIALGLSVSGMVLMGTKFLYGFLCDQYSAFHANNLFTVIVMAGLILCCMIRGSELRMMAAFILFSAGASMTSVGPAAWMKDLSSSEDFDRYNRRIQMGYSIGGMVFSVVPGMLADRFHGSYIPAYIFFIGCTVITMVIIQGFYLSRRRKPV